jgi:perosamine synthetase
MAENSFIPFHVPSIGQEEIDAVNQVLASRWLTTGPVTLEFQKEFASYVGCKHALAVNSGTSALQLALDAIGLQEGDEVLVPTNTFTATAEVVTYFGAHPVLCDSAAGGFNIDPEAAERRITERTRAIMPVHIAGEPCQMARLREIALRHRLHVIEDAAHALPASYRGQRVGTISELTAFSFYATKTLSTGEGGMLTTDNDEYAERASVMRLHGIGGDAWKRYSRTGSWYYEVQDAGFKMNLPDLLSALGRAQLRKCDRFRQRRREISAYYNQQFQDIAALELPPGDSEDVEHAWHLYILRLRPELLGLDRDEFIQQLKALGIGTSVHFIPLHRQPYWARKYGHQPQDFPHAEDTFARCLSLPIYPDMTDEDMQRVAQAVQRVVTNNLREPQLLRN